MKNWSRGPKFHFDKIDQTSSHDATSKMRLFNRNLEEELWVGRDRGSIEGVGGISLHCHILVEASRRFASQRSQSRASVVQTGLCWVKCRTEKIEERWYCCLHTDEIEGAKWSFLAHRHARSSIVRGNLEGNSKSMRGIYGKELKLMQRIWEVYSKILTNPNMKPMALLWLLQNSLPFQFVLISHVHRPRTVSNNLRVVYIRW